MEPHLRKRAHDHEYKIAGFVGFLEYDGVGAVRKGEKHGEDTDPAGTYRTHQQGSGQPETVGVMLGHLGTQDKGKALVKGARLGAAERAGWGPECGAAQAGGAGPGKPGSGGPCLAEPASG